MPNTFIFVVCLGAIFSLAPFGIDMYLPALPTMAEYLNASIDDVEASVSLFLLGYAFSQLIFGPISDRFGRMPVLLAGLAIFVSGSLLTAFATDANQLYAFRFIQAVGGGASVVVFPLIKDNFDEKGSTQVISYVMAVVVVAPLIAPIIGGYALVALGWKSIFYGLAAFGALTLVAVKLLLAPSEKGTEQQREPLPTAMRRMASGYRTILGHLPAMSHILVGAFSFAGLFAFVAGSPFVYITYFGVAAQNYGLLVGLNALVMIAMNIVNARMLHRIAPTLKTIVGAFVIGAAGVALLVIGGLDLGLAWVVAGVVAYVGTLGLVSANAIAGALSHFGQDAGTGSAIFGVFQFGFGAISSMIISTLDSTDASAMVTVMAGCGVLAFVSSLPLVFGLRRARPAPGTSDVG